MKDITIEELNGWQSLETDFVLGRMSASTFDDIAAEKVLLVHAAIGLSAEAGEFTDLVKKVVFGKREFNPETESQMRGELSDLLFYWLLAAEYVDLSMVEATRYLHNKLEGGHGWRRMWCEGENT